MQTSPHVTAGASCDCACAREKIRAVHQYLQERFRDYSLRHFHAASRSVQEGRVSPRTNHHVISISHEDAPPYFVVILKEFLDNAEPGTIGLLCEWNLADMLRSHQVVIVSNDGVAPL